MNKAGLWEGMKNWLVKSIQESNKVINIEKVIEVETLKKVLSKMKEYEKQFLR